MKTLNYLLLLSFISILFSCNQTSNTEVITSKIQYDVNIKSPDPNYDWWIQNIAGADRDKLIAKIIDGASSGKFKAFDYFNEPLTALQVRSIMSDTLVMKLMRTKEPFEEYDTAIVNDISTKDILKLRFLEKWEMNPETMQITKTVYGIAPVARRIINDVERWQPLFWIYTNEEFLESLNEK